MTSSLRFTSDPTTLAADHVAAFFEGWPTPPSPERVLGALRGADAVVLAWDGPRLVGFATAIDDGALFAAIPLVEVVPDRRGEGIGSVLVSRLLERFADRYGVDLCCDDDVVPFYERLGFSQVRGMVLRRRELLP